MCPDVYTGNIWYSANEECQMYKWKDDICDIIAGFVLKHKSWHGGTRIYPH